MENNVKGIGRPSSQITSSLKKGKKHIFGIGINDYKHWAKLRNAVNDLDGVVNILTERYDFDPAHVKILREEEATRKNIVNTLHNYTVSEVLGEDDSLLIYFSGHGFLDDNKDGYWVPVDSEQHDIDSFIPNQTIQSKIKNMKCRHVLLISDSCFSGSLTMKGDRFAKEVLVADDLEKKKSRWIMTSGGREETVSDGWGKNSPFAEAIISELKCNNKPVTIVDDLAAQIRKNTRSNAAQMPQFEKLYESGDGGGRFVFYLKDNENADWNLAISENSIVGFEAFLNKYPLSIFNAEARKKSTDLKHDSLWQQATQWHNETSYFTYLREYPTGIHAPQAKEALRILADETRWQKAKRENSGISFYEYLEAFPEGKYVTQAKAGLDEFEKKNQNRLAKEQSEKSAQEKSERDRLEKVKTTPKVEKEISNTSKINAPKPPKPPKQEIIEEPNSVVSTEDDDIFKLSKSSILAGVLIIVILIFMWLFHNYLVQPLIDNLTR